MIMVEAPLYVISIIARCLTSNEKPVHECMIEFYVL